MLHSAQDQGCKGSLHLVPSPSCAEIATHFIVRVLEERSEEKTKTPYSLEINLITTRLSAETSTAVR